MKIAVFCSANKNIDPDFFTMTEEMGKWMAEETAKAIFTSGDAANMAAVKLEDDAFTDGSIDIVSLIHAAGLAATKSEARRVVSQGGASVAGEKVSDITAKFDKEFFAGDGVVVG